MGMTKVEGHAHLLYPRALMTSIAGLRGLAWRRARNVVRG